jgi:hypothetical protein
MLNYTRIPAPRVTIVDPQTGIVSNEWFRFFNNLYTIAYAATNTVTSGTYGTVARVPQITVNEFGTITAISDLLIQIDASQIVSGIIASARIQGAYTGITGVGTLTLGTWNASTIGVGYGGTGQTSYTDGQLLIGNSTGNTLTKATLTAGTAIGISNGAGAITITNTLPDQTVVLNNGTGISVTGTYPNFTITNTSPSSGGTVTSVAALTLGTAGTDLSSTVANGTTTPVITLNVPTASATNRGALSSTDWSTFNGKQAALVSGTNIKTVSGVSLLGSGDVGTIGTGYGGTGLTSFTSSGVVYASSTSALATSANLTFDGTNLIAAGQIKATGSYLISTANSGNGYISPQSASACNIGTDFGRLNLVAGTVGVAASIFTSGGVSIGNSTDPGASNLSVTGTGKFGTTVGVGAATPSTSGAGITFPATQSASTDVNTLDDYEEGTFDVTLTPGTSGALNVYSSYNKLSYTKIGQRVFVSGLIIIETISVPVGTYVTLSSLPFQVSNLTEGAGHSNGIASWYDSSIATHSASLIPVRISNNATVALMTINAAILGNDDQITFSFSYIAA